MCVHYFGQFVSELGILTTALADLTAWRAKRYMLGPPYMEEYHKIVPKSEPKEDWDDRNLLYSM
jgi:hypothetical protein